MRGCTAFCFSLAVARRTAEPTNVGISVLHSVSPLIEKTIAGDMNSPGFNSKKAPHTT
jgi:hypothetical protein